MKIPPGTTKVHIDQVTFLSSNPAYAVAARLDPNTFVERFLELPGNGSRSITIAGIKLNGTVIVDRGEQKKGFPIVLSEKTT